MHHRVIVVFGLLLSALFVGLSSPAWGQSSSQSFQQLASRTGAGGGAASSSSFAVDQSTGQSGAGPSTSGSYRSGSGFVYTLDTGNPPLPVELAGFEVRADGQAAKLTWQTASETNNAGFEVQRQTENRWTQVGYVESKAPGGTTTETTSYRYATEDLPVGTHQFRLRQVDLDGSSTLTDPVQIEIQMQEAVTLNAPAPNPASRSAILAFAVKKQAKTTIALYNTLGQQVATLYEGTPQAGEQQTARVEVTGLPSGTYFLRLQAGEEVQTQRLTVVH